MPPAAIPHSLYLVSNKISKWLTCVLHMSVFVHSSRPLTSHGGPIINYSNGLAQLLLIGLLHSAPIQGKFPSWALLPNTGQALVITPPTRLAAPSSQSPHHEGGTPKPILLGSMQCIPFPHGQDRRECHKHLPFLPPVGLQHIQTSLLLGALLTLAASSCLPVCTSPKPLVIHVSH